MNPLRRFLLGAVLALATVATGFSQYETVARTDSYARRPGAIAGTVAAGDARHSRTRAGSNGSAALSPATDVVELVVDAASARVCRGRCLRSRAAR